MTTIIDLGSVVNSLESNPSGDEVIAGGRDLLRLFSIRGGNLHEKKNLRMGLKKNVDWTFQDVAWNPLDWGKVATGSTTGTVVLWDILRPKNTSGTELILRDHRRTTNRVAWDNDGRLLTASQDGTCILFEPKGSNTTSTVFELHGDAVRDIQWNPFNANQFAAVCEDGSLQLWDHRHPAGPLASIASHSGLASCVHWHPHIPNIIATGGRDKVVHIWAISPSQLYSSQQSSSSYNTSSSFSIGGDADHYSVSQDNERISQSWQAQLLRALRRNPSKQSSAGSNVRPQAAFESMTGATPERFSEQSRLHTTGSAFSAFSNTLNQPSPLGDAYKLETPATSYPSINISNQAGVSSSTSTTGSKGVFTLLVSLHAVTGISKLRWRSSTNNVPNIVASGQDVPRTRTQPTTPETHLAQTPDSHISLTEQQRVANPGKYQRFMNTPYYAQSSSPGNTGDLRRQAQRATAYVFPAQTFQIATCASLLDESASIWDIRTPHLPVAVFSGVHKDVVTGIAWIPPFWKLPEQLHTRTGPVLQPQELSLKSKRQLQGPRTTDLSKTARTLLHTDFGMGDALSPQFLQSGEKRHFFLSRHHSHTSFCPSNWLVTAGKDGRIAINSPLTAIRPYAGIRTTALALAPGAFVVMQQPLDRPDMQESLYGFWDASDCEGNVIRTRRLSAVDPRGKSDAVNIRLDGVQGLSTPLGLDPSTESGTSTPLRGTQFVGGHLDVQDVSISRGSAVFRVNEDMEKGPMERKWRHLSREYLMEGMPPSQLMSYNAKVARTYDEKDALHVWQTLSVLFQQIKPSKNQASPVANVSEDHLNSSSKRIAPQNLKDWKMAVKEVILQIPTEEDVRGNEKVRLKGTLTPRVLDLFESSKDRGIHGMSNVESLLDARGTSETNEMIYLDPPTLKELTTPGYILGLNQALDLCNPKINLLYALIHEQRTLSFRYAMHEKQSTTELIMDLPQQPEKLIGGSSALGGIEPVEGKSVSIAGGDAKNQDVAVAYSTVSQSEPTPALGTDVVETGMLGENTKGLPTLEEADQSDWETIIVDIAIDIIEYYCNIGDILHATTIARCCGYLYEQRCGVRKLQMLFMAYIETLQRLRLPLLAAHVASISGQPGLADHYGLRLANEFPTCLSCILAIPTFDKLERKKKSLVRSMFGSKSTQSTCHSCRYNSILVEKSISTAKKPVTVKQDDISPPPVSYATCISCDEKESPPQISLACRSCKKTVHVKCMENILQTREIICASVPNALCSWSPMPAFRIV